MHFKLGLAGLAAGLVASSLVVATEATVPTLYEYVHAPNPVYNYSLGAYNNAVTVGWGWQAFYMNLTSGTYMSPNYTVNRYIWTHVVGVVMPDILSGKAFETAAIWVTGNHPSAVPISLDPDLEVCGIIANSTGIPCLILFDIPSQPIIFSADPTKRGRSEDAAVAYSWNLFLQQAAGGAEADPTQLLHWPMTRAVSKAMDAGEDYLGKQGIPIKKWMVFGASKRGWTTWLAGAVEQDRVIGICPIVFDLLNLESGFQRMHQSLGNWSFVMSDYVDNDIPAAIGTPGFTLLAQYMDPLNYRANLTMPKLVINAAGDEFFNLWDDWTWWGQLPGESLRFLVDDAEHTMATGFTRVLKTATAWLWALLTNTPRPTPTWQLNSNDGSIVLNVAAQPGTPQVSQVVLRVANTLQPVRKDFRLVTGNTPANPCNNGIPVPILGGGCLVPMLWTPTDIAINSSTTYTFSQPTPTTGWRAFLVSLYYPGPVGTNTTYEITTQASVIPLTWPFPPCEGEACMGGFV